MGTRIEVYNIKGTVKRTQKTVVLELQTSNGALELHFGDPTQIMNLFLLMIEEMAKVFPDFEMSKLWRDDSFK
jgi:hypothetical protein